MENFVEKIVEWIKNALISINKFFKGNNGNSFTASYLAIMSGIIILIFLSIKCYSDYKEAKQSESNSNETTALSNTSNKPKYEILVTEYEYPYAYSMDMVEFSYDIGWTLQYEENKYPNADVRKGKASALIEESCEFVASKTNINDILDYDGRFTKKFIFDVKKEAKERFEKEELRLTKLKLIRVKKI